MGRPKHELVLTGDTMLSRQIRLVRSVSRSVALVGLPADPQRASFSQVRASGVEASLLEGVGVLPDAVAGRGPLGGIYTGLSWTRTEFNLFLGCDLPFITSRFLSYLSRYALSCQADVTVPESREGHYQPLCAVYRRRALPVVAARLARGENKVSRFFRYTRCRVVAWPEIARAGFPAGIFGNMNTPEDYAAAQRRLQVFSRTESGP